MNLMLPAANLGVSRQGCAFLLQEVSSREMLLGTLKSTDGFVFLKKEDNKICPASSVGKGSNLTGQERGAGRRCSELSPASL